MKFTLSKNQWIPAAGIAIAVLLILLIAVLNPNKKSVISEETAAGRAYITEESRKNVLEIQNRIDSAKENANTGAEGGIADLPDLQSQIDSLQIRELTPEEIYSYRDRLASTIIVGDSMAQAVLEYELLDENHVMYQRSASISQLDEQISAALSMLPDTIVFFMGLNDINYFEDPSEYYNAFAQKIFWIKEQRPDLRILICSMLPPSEDLAAEREDLARSPEYDAMLSLLCEQTGCLYADCKWMVRQELYLEDGLHFNYGFYCVWLQYIAGILSGDGSF